MVAESMNILKTIESYTLQGTLYRGQLGGMWIIAIRQ